MKNGKQKEINYRIEREFLNKVTVQELISRIIRSHIKKDQETGGMVL